MKNKHSSLLYSKLNFEPSSIKILPDCRWFGNTRLTEQKHLKTSQIKKINDNMDSYSVAASVRKTPISIAEKIDKKIFSKGKQINVNLITSQPFNDVFGSITQRKKPNANSLHIKRFFKWNKFDENFSTNNYKNISQNEKLTACPKNPRFEKGQSKRIWK